MTDVMPEVTADPREFYASHSPFTDPGPHAGLYDDLPRDLPSVAGIVQGNVLHLSMGWFYGYVVPEDLKAEADIPQIALILDRIMVRDSAPLHMPRAWDRKFVGHCRVCAVFFASMLRHRAIPVVARGGFSAYHGNGIRGENWCLWLCEYWNEQEGRWVLYDSQMDENLQAQIAPDFSPHDIPRDRFITAGQAWLACRRGEADPSHYGLDSTFNGMSYIRAQLLRDMASLNKQEVGANAVWGLSALPDEALSEDDLALLDRVAEATNAGPENHAELRHLYESELGLGIRD
jgi:hypothetical protein